MIPFFWSLLVSYASILISLGLIALAAFYGWLFLKLFSGRTHLNIETLVFSIGLGFGILSFITLSLGICNLLYSRLIIFLFIFATIPAVYVLIRLVIKKITSGFHPSSYALRPILFWLILILYLALAQLNIALLPPYEYDALEYHFGVPDYYLQQHKITYVPGNVYANFPANTEMLYTLGMVLNDDVTGKLFHFYFGILAALGLYAIAKKLWSDTAGAISALIFLGLPIIFQLNYQANIDLALAGYSVLALFAFINWRKEKQLPDLILVGIFVGLGLGCKYTAMLTIAIPIFILILIYTFINPKFGTWYFVVSAFILILPWCIKNLIFTGNPVFPLFYSVLDGYGWNPDLAKKFMQAHLSFNLIKPLFQDYSRIIILTLLVLILPLKKDKTIRFIFLYILFGYLLWFFFTEHIERFLMPILPLVALGLGYLVCHYIKHISIKYTLSAVAAIVVLFIGIRISPVLPPVGLNKAEWRRQFILDTKLSIYPAYEYIYYLPENATLLFIAEARRHYLTRPAILNTVFDRSPIFELAKSAKSSEDIYLGLREMKITHILYNPYELKRLTDFYGPYFNWETSEQQHNFNDFFDTYAQVEWTWYDMKIYRLKT